MQQDLFGNYVSDNDVTIVNARKIEGLNIHFNFISANEELVILKHIDAADWLHDLKRRVQHYGYKYDYRAKQIDDSFFIGAIPEWMKFLWERLLYQGIIDFIPDQAIINEYMEGQGIAPHIDCEPCFGDTIISISLGSTCVMNFQKTLEAKENEKIPLLLTPRTLVVMQNEARFNWYHGIVGRKSDVFNGSSYKRRRRVSITFRKVNLCFSKKLRQ